MGTAMPANSFAVSRTDCDSIVTISGASVVKFLHFGNVLRDSDSGVGSVRADHTPAALVDRRQL